MDKEAFYFPHFCNARHDRKIRRLRRELGVEGYGIYFMLLETLREQQDLMYPMDDLDLLSDEFGVSEAKIRTTICNYELFEVDMDQKFFSPKMLVYLEPYFRMKEQRKMAGQKSAENRKLNSRSTVVEQRKEKERKGNESKVNEIKENDNEIVDFITFRDQLFNTWFDYKKQKKSSYTEIGKNTLIKQWESKTDDQLQSAIEHSIANNYQGLFEPKNNNSVIGEKKGKIQANLENINTAQQAIKHNMKDGKVINNPFDISKW